MSRNIQENLPNTPLVQVRESFWQGRLWSAILSQTQQAEPWMMNYRGTMWLFERRSIIGSQTAVYALGTPNIQITQDFVHKLRPYLTSNDLFVQIEPLGNTEERDTYIARAPFRRFLEPTTAILTIGDATEATLMETFAEKGRYNIRVAERRGLKTQWVKGDDICTLQLPGKTQTIHTTYGEIFFELLQETTERDRFSHNALHYYQTFLRVLESEHAGGLLVVSKDNTLHAAGIFVYWNGQAIYYYGASSNKQEIRRDHGTYFLQWEAIKEALRRNCTTYDFLGISSQEGDKLSGVTTFKMRFNPLKVSLPKEKVIVLKPYLLRLLILIRHLRKWGRK